MKPAHKSFLTRSRLGILILLVSAAGLLTQSLRPVQPVRGMEAKPSHSAAALEQLKKDGSYSSLAAALNAARYQMRPASHTGTHRVWEASNPAQNWQASFSPTEIRITAQTETDSGQKKIPWKIGMTLTGYGYGAALAPVGQGEMKGQGERVEIHKSAITEWYINKPEGLEQGFTLTHPPARSADSSDRLHLRLRVTGELRAELAADSQSVLLKDDRGRAVISYDHLAAWDANHRALPAAMNANGNEITLEINDADAVYPVTIDPTFTQFNKLTASDGAANDHFGGRVAISGDTVVIAAPDDDGSFADQGSAYVFVRSGSAWTQQAKLVANDGAANDHFGNDVAIDGNTVIVGAEEATVDGGQKVGAAYLFVRSGATWTQQAKVSPGFLVNSFTRFGSAVAISGNTAVIGAKSEDVNFDQDRGSVYIYTRSGTTWTRQQKLTASDGVQFDQLGNAVAISGETMLAGAFTSGNKGAAYVFNRIGSTWTQQAKLLASDGSPLDFFGQSVALSGDSAVIGANGADINGNQNQGAAYVFTRNGTSWTQQIKLTASDGLEGNVFGVSVVISGDSIAVGAPLADFSGSTDQGAVYVFTLLGTTWTQQQKFTANNPSFGANLGTSLAISGDTLIAGADYDKINGNAGQGAGYIFQLSRRYPLTDTLSAGDGTANDHFGLSVAINGTVAAIGAPDEDINGQQDQGAVYVFTRSSPAAITWTFQQKLTNGTGGDHFGSAVAIGNSVMLIGVPTDDVFGSLDQGSVYAYTFSVNAWSFQQQIFAADPAAGDRFGASVSVSGSTAIVGSPYATISGKADQGAAYAFTQSGNVWTQQQKLTASDGAASDFFGRDVSVDANTAVVGADRHNVGGIADQGAAYVFFRSGGVWSQQTQLTANDGALNDYLGSAVAVSGDTALIGAEGDDPSGAAYVFTRSGATWSQQAKLKASDESSIYSRFGGDVALSGNTALVGAYLSEINGESNQGAAYVYTRSGSTWTQQQKLLASNGQLGDELGYAVAIDPGTKAALVSAPFRNSGQGAVYFFSDPLALSISPGTLPGGTAGVAYNQPLAPSIGTLPYAFFFVSGVMPPGLSLSFDGQAAATLSGTPTKTGTFNFTLGVNDAQGFYGTQNYSITINCAALSINPATAPAATAGQAYHLPLIVPGGIAPFTFTLFGSLPTGVTLNTTTGVIAGTPAVSGVFQFQVGVTDANACESLRAYALNVACPAITINPASLPNATVGTPYSQPFSASGGSGQYSFNLNNGDALPPGLAIVNGALTGTPIQAGTFNFTIKAIDQSGCFGSRGYAVTVVNNCPVITVLPVGLQNGSLNTLYSQTLTGSGGQAPYTAGLTAGSLPPGLSLNFGNQITGAPTQLGTFNFTITLTDANQCTGQRSYTLTVSPSCNTLSATPATLPAGTEGVAYNQALTGSGGVAPYTFGIEQAALPVPGLALNPNGTISGMPTAAGTFPFDVEIADVNGCVGTSHHTITINSLCATITLGPGTLPAASIGQSYGETLTAQGGAPGYTFALTAGALPGGMALGVTGELTGSPNQTGTFNFTVMATDANGCTGQKGYAITVGCPVITIVPPPPNGSVGNAYNHTFNATGNAGPYSYSIIGGTLPTGLTLSPAGALTGTPTQTGNFNFTVRAGSANGCTGETSHTINIVTCPAINIAQPNLSLATVGTVYGIQLNANGGVGAYNWSLTAGSLPNGLTFTGAGFFTGTPAQAGNFPISVRATDANGCIGDKNYVLVVNAAGCPTITVTPNTLPNGFNGMTYSQQLSASSGSGPYTYAVTAGSLPSGLTLSPSGLISGTLAAVGIGTFTVTATDANQCVGQREYQFTAVNCAGITVNPATLPSGTVNVGYNQTITADFGIPPYSFAVTGGALPAGLTLFSAGVLSGTPTASGNFNFTVTATASNGCPAQRAYSLVINAPCPTIAINPATLPNAQAGANYSQQLTASGGNSPYTITLNAGSSLPNGLTLTGAGLLSGTPTVFGSFNFTVKATDNSGCFGSRAYSLTVTPPCAAITVNPATLPNGTVGTAYNQTTTATGGTAPYTFSISAGSMPGGLNLASGGALTGTPSAAGVFNFTVKATDANGCLGTRAYSVVINPNGGGGNAGLQFYPLPKPLRLLDTRPGQVGCDAPGAQIPGNTSRTQLARRSCDGITIPAGAMAVTGNITTVQSGGGYLTLYPSDAAQPLVANSNYAANEIINNVFTVGLGNADGSFKIFVTSPTHVVVDITGYYAPPAAGGLYFHPLPKPIRLLETRAGFNGAFTPGVKLQGNADTPQQSHVTYDGVTIPNTTLAIVGNATTINGGAGYMTLYPGGVPRPLAASSNFSDGQVMNAPFTVGLSATGEFNIFTTTNIDVIVDVLGYYSTEANDANGAGLLFNSLPSPVRLLETRAGFTGCYAPNAPLLTGSIRQQQARGACGGQTIANNALAIVGNATVINDQAGYLTFWPNGASQPLVASSNFASGQVLNRHFTVGLGATGIYNIFASGQTDLIVDVSGYFAP